MVKALNKGPFTTTLLCSLVVSFGGGIGYGYDSGVIASTMAVPAFAAYFDEPTPAEKGAIVACFQVGALLGALGVSFVSDKLGRRKTMFLGALLGILGGALMCGAAHIAMLIIGRILLGGFIGLATSTAPVYSAEIARPHERGRISAVQQLMLAFGFLIANWTGYGFNQTTTGNVQWRAPYGIQIVPSLLLAAGVWLVPESPRWLVLKGRHEQARAALRRLHFDGENGDFIDDELAEIIEHVEAEKALEKYTWRSAFNSKSRRRRLALGCGVWFFAMLSGISFIQYFQPSIYATLGWDVSRQLLVTGLYGMIAPVAVIISLVCIDKFSRVTLLSGSSFSICGLYAILTAMRMAFPAIPGEPVNVPAQYVTVACVFAISAVFSATLGPLGWVYPPECFSTQLRSVGNSLVHVVHYLTSICISQASPVGLANEGASFFIFFVVMNGVASIVFLLFYPDTRHKTLEELDAIFGDDAVETRRRQLGDSKLEDERVEDKASV